MDCEKVIESLQSQKNPETVAGMAYSLPGDGTLLLETGKELERIWSS